MLDEQGFAAILQSLSLDEEASFVGVVDPLIAYLGLETRERELNEDLMWDGATFNANLPDRHLFHEVAHWLLASPERRQVAEFGLGPGPETGPDLDVDILVSDSDRAEEEARAALLGLLLQHHMGVPCGLMAEEVGLAYSGVLIEGNLFKGWVPAYRWLRENDVISVDGVPTVLSDMRTLGLVDDPLGRPESRLTFLS